MRRTRRDAREEILAAADLPGGGTFTHDARFDAPGVHVGTRLAERAGESFAHDLRLDVLAHAWVG